MLARRTYPSSGRCAAIGKSEIRIADAMLKVELLLSQVYNQRMIRASSCNAACRSVSGSVSKRSPSAEAFASGLNQMIPPNRGYCAAEYGCLRQASLGLCDQLNEYLSACASMSGIRRKTLGATRYFPLLHAAAIAMCLFSCFITRPGLFRNRR